MRSGWMVAGLVAAGFLVGPFAFPAQAGQATGHNIETIVCEGLGTVDVSVQPSNSENTWGAVQLVGARGHLIPVVFEFTVENLTTDTVVLSETAAKGSGQANRNQELVTCSLTFTGTFEEIAEPGEERPPGVDPDDILQVTVTVQVVAKV